MTEKMKDKLTLLNLAIVPVSANLFSPLDLMAQSNKLWGNNYQMLLEYNEAPSN